ncbi:hypothetical protein MKEN_00291900 [Mycena kentingensis (nom. inval.)]|nr:hypothetical protein MKEN_00291900 [Mycena kentingensis (nom. inval.)]
MSSPRPLRDGLVNAPTTPAARAKLLTLLQKDCESHHCFINKLRFHNHLPHHLVAAYDMGATPELLQAIFDEEAPKLKPVDLEGGEVTEENWTERLDQPAAYGRYLEFFAAQIAKYGAGKVIEEYVFSPKANGNGAKMFARLLGGAFHAFLQIGFGLEFGHDGMVAAGLAQTALTESTQPAFYLDQNTDLPLLVVDPVPGTTLLQLLREVYASDLLAPVMPYNPDALLSQRIRDIIAKPERGAELQRIYSKWSLDLSKSPADIDVDVAQKVEECLVQATLLLAATGRRGYAPRLDFFLMHILTSAICLPSLLGALSKPEHKAMVLQGYARASAMYVLLRGRPRINIPLLMSYTAEPKPPVKSSANAEAIGAGLPTTNPWLAMIHNGLHHPDAHVLKSIRSLYYAATHYGAARPAGSFAGAKDEDEYHDGAGLVLDGSVFVRAAGVISETLGWVAYGKEPGSWDRSALGWDAAWEGEGKIPYDVQDFGG